MTLLIRFEHIGPGLEFYDERSGFVWHDFSKPSTRAFRSGRAINRMGRDSCMGNRRYAAGPSNRLRQGQLDHGNWEQNLIGGPSKIEE
jgi:hypothetical protein